MPPRKTVTKAAIKAIAGEVAGLPLGSGRAKLHADMLELLMTEIARLRELPLKEVEPAFVYRPIESKAGKGR